MNKHNFFFLSSKKIPTFSPKKGMLQCIEDNLAAFNLIEIKIQMRKIKIAKVCNYEQVRILSRNNLLLTQFEAALSDSIERAEKLLKRLSRIYWNEFIPMNLQTTMKYFFCVFSS
jgi:hypothetical protein